uniref:Glycosyltransferase n=1 Tax=Strobilanthes cusia TaxID=222567 RepID=A0A3Q8U927_9LAMI|nr:UDP-glycosyltransferase [Strobilanthes cusia]
MTGQHQHQHQPWKPHAIMISVPYQGHINPFVNLALKLASRDIVVTFVHLEYVHHKLSSKPSQNTPPTATAPQSQLFSQARQSGLDIRYTTISDGFPVEFDRDLHIDEYWHSLLHDFPGLVDQFVGNLIRSSSSVDPCLKHFLVADTVYSWPANVARNHNLMYVSFWTEPALVFSLCYHWDIVKEKGHHSCNDNQTDVEINYLPGIRPISWKDLMSYFKEEGSTIAVGLPRAFRGVKTAGDFILHNTVHELESETLSILSKYHPTYAIGPINFSKGLPKDTTSQSLWSESDCTQWLDSKSPGSVLYISFGSLVQIPKQVMEEIAYGLVLSGVNFIWVVRTGLVSHGDQDNNVLPDGYEDAIKDQGLLIPWCNQLNVLSNPAVGGFLTHCGRNSIVESMWHGVPLLCYPVTWDQPTNRKLVVDDWKIGINLCDGTVVDRKEVADTIKGFMYGENSDKLRREVSWVKETMRKAMENDGSSEMNFDQFVKDLMGKIVGK